MEFISYLLDPKPGSAFQYYIPAIVFTVLIAIAAIAFRHIYNSKKKSDPVFRKTFRNTQRNFWLFFGLFAFLIAVRYENIPYFSMRLWLLVAGLWFAYAIRRGLLRYKNQYKVQTEKEASRKAQSEQNAAMNKYTPSKKKKRK